MPHDPMSLGPSLLKQPANRDNCPFLVKPAHYCTHDLGLLLIIILQFAPFDCLRHELFDMLLAHLDREPSTPECFDPQPSSNLSRLADPPDQPAQDDLAPTTSR